MLGKSPGWWVEFLIETAGLALLIIYAHWQVLLGVYLFMWAGRMELHRELREKTGFISSMVLGAIRENSRLREAMMRGERDE